MKPWVKEPLRWSLRSMSEEVRLSKCALFSAKVGLLKSSDFWWIVESFSLWNLRTLERRMRRRQRAKVTSWCQRSLPLTLLLCNTTKREDAAWWRLKVLVSLVRVRSWQILERFSWPSFGEMVCVDSGGVMKLISLKRSLSGIKVMMIFKKARRSSCEARFLGKVLTHKTQIW